MKELNKKNKFGHKLGPSGYKATMQIWTKKEQELREARIPYPLEGYTVRTKNWIWGQSRTYDSRRLVTSSSKVTMIIEKVKTLTAK
jgi:hypothetical protein